MNLQACVLSINSLSSVVGMAIVDITSHARMMGLVVASWHPRIMGLLWMFPAYPQGGCPSLPTPMMTLTKALFTPHCHISGKLVFFMVLLFLKKLLSCVWSFLNCFLFICCTVHIFCTSVWDVNTNNRSEEILQVIQVLQDWHAALFSLWVCKMLVSSKLMRDIALWYHFYCGQKYTEFT